VLLDHFEGDAYRAPDVGALLARTRAVPYMGPLYDEDDPFDAEVAITLADGRTLTEKVDRPLGRASDNPIAPEHMKAKFEDCAGRVLAPAAVAKACRAIETLEKLSTVRELTALLEPQAKVAEKSRGKKHAGV